MQIEFYLGKGSSNFDHRAVRVLDVSTVPPTEVYSQNLAGTDETVQIDLTVNKIYQLILIDRAHGISGKPTIFGFTTSMSGLGFQSGEVRIIGIEDESSSSSLSSSSSSSSPSSSSSSSLSSGTSMSSSSSSSPSSLSSTSSPTSGSSSSSTSSSRSSSSSSMSSSSTSSASSSSLSSSSSSS